ncbi:MAG: T9SS type A sorting domain-containing protein, partial [Paludibacteraceae bacterium]|nr:T9SS type A sorting domain-containing protein [Paludibacteraceae bacterium]
TWSLGSRDSIITDFVIGDNHREYMYQNILGCDSAKFILDVAVWPAAKDEPVKYDTILVDNLPYIWSTYTDKTIACYTADTYRDTAFNILGCDSIRYTLELAIIAHDTVTLPVEADLCHGETYTSRWQEVTPRFVGDTTFSDTVPSIMMNPLLMRDSIYAYTLHVQSRYIDKLPALVKDDSWLLMIHRRSIREDYGIDFTADQVHWYRVEGEVDEYPYGEDNDVQVGTGDYYTIAQKMSGKYYALLDVDVSWLNACALYARTVILDCDNPSGPVLSPTIVPAGGLMKLTNLQEGELTINVYTPAGQKVRSESVKVNNEHDIYAERVCGVYLLQVTNVGKTNVFKYVVTQ